MTVSDQELMIIFYPENCTQCMGCQSACKSWKETPYGVIFRRVLNLWDGCYPEVLNSSLSLGCLHCVSPTCVDVCPVEAITKSADNGLVEVNCDLCIGCKSCFEACPYSVPQFGEDDIMVKCDLCQGLLIPPCVDTCPGDALAMVSITSSEKKMIEKQSIKLLNNSQITKSKR